MRQAQGALPPRPGFPLSAALSPQKRQDAVPHGSDPQRVATRETLCSCPWQEATISRLTINLNFINDIIFISLILMDLKNSSL
jgi:hypothetical protein